PRRLPPPPRPRRARRPPSGARVAPSRGRPDAAPRAPGSDHEGEGAESAHGAGLLPAAEGDTEIPRPGRHDQPIAADEPRPTRVGEADDGAAQVAHGRSGAEGPPRADAELDVDPGLDRVLEGRIRLDDALQHGAPVPYDLAHALAEVERDVHGHQVEVEG